MGASPCRLPARGGKAQAAMRRAGRAQDDRSVAVSLEAEDTTFTLRCRHMGGADGARGPAISMMPNTVPAAHACNIARTST